MNIKLLLLAVLLVNAGCASFPNPFRREHNEDYNALTYGDDYKERGGDWAPKKVRIDREDLYGSMPPARQRLDESARTVAAKDPTNLYDDEILDPTEESVRQNLMVNRGHAVADYVRGDRATRADFLDDTLNDGSLWSNENDANYFFTKGKARTLGDIISIKLEDPFVRQVADEVKKSLTPAEQEVEMALYLKNADGAKGDKDIQNFRTVASDDLKTSEATETKEKMQKAVRWAQVDLSKALALAPNEELRAEVIDKYKNGNFKIRAVKRVLYRGSSKLVSVVAVAPAQDFDEKDSIQSGKLYEYKIKVAR